MSDNIQPKAKRAKYVSFTEDEIKKFTNYVDKIKKLHNDRIKALYKSKETDNKINILKKQMNNEMNVINDIHGIDIDILNSMYNCLQYDNIIEDDKKEDKYIEALKHFKTAIQITIDMRECQSERTKQIKKCDDISKYIEELTT
jgi:Asp-tRNA(Asn)/Glu-tRNA(Gln) amidotransferase C subunit